MKFKLSLVIIIIALIGGGVYLYNQENISKKTEEIKNETTQKTDDTIDIEKRIGQMLMVGFRGTTIENSSDIAQKIKDLNLGGIILFDYDAPSKSYPRNIEDPQQLKKLITDLQSYAQTPLFVGIDVEGGLVNRLKPKYGFIEIPSHEKMGNLSLQEIKKISEKLALELKGLGINMNFAPVVDVNVNPKNPVIGSLGRSFSKDPETVIQDASAFIAPQRENDIISVIKHFPGHGSSGTDSHIGLVDVTDTYQSKELIPFKELIKENLTDAVMTAHVINRSIDPVYPATLSPNFLKNILQEKLGFQGIIVSDDMQMGAIVKHFGFDDALIRAINSGVDLIVLSNNIDSYDPEIAVKAKNAIEEALKNGTISQQHIIEASDKILSIKTEYHIK